MIETKELFFALKKLHNYALELNEQRVKDGKEWLRDFSECGFYVGPAFYELSKSDSYTRLYGGITEIELHVTVCVAYRHDADEYVEIVFEGYDKTQVRQLVADLISHFGL